MSDTNTSSQEQPTVILDLGKHKRKQIKRLRKGGGPLMADVKSALAEYQQNGTIAAGSQVVVVVVGQKRRKGLMGLL
jgi:phage gp45-like